MPTSCCCWVFWLAGTVVSHSLIYMSYSNIFILYKCITNDSWRCGSRGSPWGLLDDTPTLGVELSGYCLLECKLTSNYETFYETVLQWRDIFYKWVLVLGQCQSRRSKYSNRVVRVSETTKYLVDFHHPSWPLHSLAGACSTTQAPLIMASLQVAKIEQGVSML